MKKVLILIIILKSTLTFGQVSNEKQAYSDCKYLNTPNYIVNKTNVYFEKCAIHRKVNVIPKALKTLGKSLAHDGRNIFYNGIRIDIKPKNLKPIFANRYDLIWINDNSIYKNTMKLNTIDYDTFVTLDRGSYTKDKAHVFHLGTLIKGADPKSFVSQYPLSYDKNFAYSGTKKIKKKGYLKSVNGYFFKDHRNVYTTTSSYDNSLKLMPNLKTENCISIEGSKYGIINDTLFFLDRKTKITNLLAEHINVIDNDLLTYKNTLIYRGYTTEKIDTHSLRVIEGNSDYRKIISDKNRTYKISIEREYNNPNYIQIVPIEPKPEKEITYNTHYDKTQLFYDKTHVFLNTQPLAKIEFFVAKGIEKPKDMEIVSVLKGYRPGCSQDHTPGSNYYILKDTKGFWEFKLSRENTLKYIGKTYKF